MWLCVSSEKIQAPCPKFKVIKTCFGLVTARCATKAKMPAREVSLNHWLETRGVCIWSYFQQLLPTLLFNSSLPFSLTSGLNQILRFQTTISLSIKWFSESITWLVQMMAGTSWRPGTVGQQEMLLSVILGALAPTIQWERYQCPFYWGYLKRLSDLPTTEVFHLQGLWRPFYSVWRGTWLPGRCLGPQIAEIQGGDRVPAKCFWKHLWALYA